MRSTAAGIGLVVLLAAITAIGWTSGGNPAAPPAAQAAPANSPDGQRAPAEVANNAAQPAAPRAPRDVIRVTALEDVEIAPGDPVLQQTVPDVTFTETPLEEVVNWVGDTTKLNIVPHWMTLEDAGIRRDKLITVRAHNLRVNEMLWLITNQTGSPDVQVGFEPDGRMVQISTREDLNRLMVVRIYDATPVLAQMEHAPAANPPDPSADCRMQTLVCLVRDIASPDAWRENGGSGSIVPFGNLLVVRQHRAGQRQVAQVLNALAEAQAPATPADTHR